MMRTASYNQLRTEGFRPTKRALEPVNTWPPSCRIVLEHESGDRGYEHTYSVSNDTSDYYGDDWPHQWHEVQFVAVSLWKVVQS